MSTINRPDKYFAQLGVKIERAVMHDAPSSLFLPFFTPPRRIETETQTQNDGESTTHKTKDARRKNIDGHRANKNTERKIWIRLFLEQMRQELLQTATPSEPLVGSALAFVKMGIDAHAL